MTPGGASEAIRQAVREAVREVNQKTMSKAFRVSNAMRNSAIEVLTQRVCGRIYDDNDRDDYG